MFQKGWMVYIMTNDKRWTLYIWVTSDLRRRVWEHKNNIDSRSFTTQYNCKKLVFYEWHNDIESAIAKEKQLKNWHRDWKINLIESQNMSWSDLYEEILE